MIKAGSPTDNMINALLPLLDDEDILIDGGNTNYQDTIRRNKTLAESGVNFIGMGVSGGEVGALTGPSLMPGGQEAAYNKVSDILDAIRSARWCILRNIHWPKWCRSLCENGS